MIWLQVSAGRGPVECEWVVAQVLATICREAGNLGVKIEITGRVPGEYKDGCKSALFSLDGPGDRQLAARWTGSVQWIGSSAYRPGHKRRNWFVGIFPVESVSEKAISGGEIRIETMRASGPGGQHVNKTDSAVRVTHLASGLSAIARDRRSQHQNRQAALGRLALLLQEAKTKQVNAARQQQWQQHDNLVRGNPVRIFRGRNFKEVRIMKAHN